MAAIDYESASSNWHEDDDFRPKITPTAKARSFLLRALDSSIAVRNNMDVMSIPDYVSCELDELVCFIESRGFDEMKAHADAYLHKQHMRRGIGQFALAGGSVSHEDCMPAPGGFGNAVSTQVLTSFAFERFHSVNSRHLYNLGEVSIEGGLPEDPIEKDRGVMRIIATAIEDIDERGLDLHQSEAAKALGYAEQRPNGYPWLS